MGEGVVEGGIAKDWYVQGLAVTPGAGKSHHHLGLLSREKEGEELRALYHFIHRYVPILLLNSSYAQIILNSMTTLHPFLTSRESVVPIWPSATQ